MPVAITIRHVPAATRDRLAAQAAASGRSLPEYLSRELEGPASRPSVDGWLADARRVAADGGPVSVADVLADLDAGRA
ncbi:hypothetical protein QT381_05430 [Galbitalea sp. SE-J8]|uniref:FitA-like ribbon-helix-helix domain-containing protein n=1 Tax=Galbitalea sp. SE-J8 TaxID=3054952 RepID=UPI00259CCD6B|nr:hypothetical protein [Galbitalea sp. SE-J8]MDM4762444.1 hypothetical protein [Galbitalea sp. SE-J8]